MNPYLWALFYRYEVVETLKKSDSCTRRAIRIPFEVIYIVSVALYTARILIEYLIMLGFAPLSSAVRATSSWP
jgi:hypothetical protein